MYMLYLWVGVAVLAAIIEAVTMGLISVWFVVGALAGIIAFLMGWGENVQIIIFLAFSLGSLICIRPLVKSAGQQGRANEATMIGTHALVCETIDNAKNTGRVRVSNEMTWAARSESGEIIEVGEDVVVVNQESVKLIVGRSE